MGKAVFPKELLCDEFNESNKKWLEEYRRETKLKPSYYQRIENFFKFREYQDKPFNTFIKEDIEKYIAVMVDRDFAVDTINFLPSALSGFKKFLKAKYPTLFKKDFLDDFSGRYIDQKSPSDAFALNLDQINLIREYNKDNFQSEYFFEIFFQLGIKKQDIIHCCPANNIGPKYYFRTQNGKVIKYNAKIAELLDKFPKDRNIKLTFVAVDYYLGKIADHLCYQNPAAYSKERPLNYSDLIKSHEKYTLKCPCCSRPTENIAKGWVLVKREIDNDYRLACSVCKGVDL